MIRIIHGDATSPQASGPKVIAQCCNDIGKWGKGFVMAVSKRWPHARTLFLDWYAGKNVDNQLVGKRVLTTGPCKLGEVQLIEVIPNDMFVANMIGQHGIATGSKGSPIRYDSLGECLEKLVPLVKTLQATVHMPKIGTGLAGGKWENIELLIDDAFEEQVVYVYERSS